MDIDYKSYVGPRKIYDICGASQFSLLVKWGLREYHTLLDYGCGSLRAGKLFIPYLMKDKYSGYEPNEHLIAAGVKNEIGLDMLKIKRPHFVYIPSKNLNLYKEFECIFDCVLIHSIFSHAPLDMIDSILRNIHDVTNDCSHIFCTYIEGNNNYKGEEWQYPEGITYTRNKMISIFKNHRFKYHFLKWKHPGNQQWVRLCKEE